MKFEFKKELPLLMIVALPFVYLFSVWHKLGDKVPLHWDINGEVDRYGSKMELVMIPFLLPVLIYVIFLVVPLIDLKGKIQKMGGKFYSLRFILTVFMSILAIFIIYSATTKELTNPNLIILGMGVLFIVLGNYFKTIKANYFIGIRTPWTLESEQVWKETHNLAGKLWFVGGLLIIIFSLILNHKINLIVFFIITITITLIPIIYSYISFKKHKNQKA
jgi:uncharacterized membrane protein